MTNITVTIEYDAYLSKGDEDVLETVGSYSGALRIESESNRYPFDMIIFDGQCSEFEGYAIEDVSSSIHEASHLINEWPEHRGVGRLDRLRFIFDDANSAMLFKLTFGGL